MASLAALIDTLPKHPMLRALDDLAAVETEDMRWLRELADRRDAESDVPHETHNSEGLA